MEFAEDEMLALNALTAEEQSVARVRRCVDQELFLGGLDLGITLLFDDNGVVTRSFTGKLPISRAENQCTKSALLGVSTQDAAQFGKMMRYDLYVSAETERVRVHPSR